MIADDELVTKTLRDGNHHFGLLVQRHSDYLFGLGMRVTRGNHALAEEVSQQAFLRAFTYLKSFNPAHSFKSWLTTIAVNVYRDMAPNEDSGEALEHSPEPAEHPDLETMTANRDFFSMIKPLNTEERIIITLRFVYDYRLNEIGEALALNTGTVKSKVSRALEKLR